MAARDPDAIDVQGPTMMDRANSKTLNRLMILVFVGLAFAFGASMLASSQTGLLFADIAAS